MKVQTVEEVALTGAHQNRLIGNQYGDGGETILMLHGGGQTRHSWEKTAIRLAALGHTVVTLDQRGHGDSDWSADGDYSFARFADDVVAMSDQLTSRFGQRPVSIGASLGGIASLAALAMHSQSLFKALVMVDIVPDMDPGGVAKIIGFMRDKVAEGFTTLDEAADFIAAYLPHRKRPDNLDGLAKNLRLHDDGRYRWHWDPRFVDGANRSEENRSMLLAKLDEKLVHLDVPICLVRGARSELVCEERASAFLAKVKNGHYYDVSEAGHMVAGDKNDAFSDAVTDFLQKL